MLFLFLSTCVCEWVFRVFVAAREKYFLLNFIEFFFDLLKNGHHTNLQTGNYQKTYEEISSSSIGSLSKIEGNFFFTLIWSLFNFYFFFYYYYYYYFVFLFFIQFISGHLISIFFSCLFRWELYDQCRINGQYTHTHTPTYDDDDGWPIELVAFNAWLQTKKKKKKKNRKKKFLKTLFCLTIYLII